MEVTDQDYEAASMAAAARFRKEVEQIQTAQQIKKKTSLEIFGEVSPALSAHATSKSRRSQSTSAKRRRPSPLDLTNSVLGADTVQSAPLPPRTSSRHIRRVASADREAREGQKQDWRRMTITGGKHSSILIMSSSGQLEEFELTLPPVPSIPQLPAAASSTASIASPKSIAKEDQIRRELEAFALEESPNIQLSRRSSFASRRRATYFPDPEDIMYDEPIPTNDLNELKALPSLPTPSPPPEPEVQSRPSHSRHKSIFSVFERRNEVDTLLDMYLTDEQIAESRLQKSKSTKVRRLTLFRKKTPAAPLSELPVST